VQYLDIQASNDSLLSIVMLIVVIQDGRKVLWVSTPLYLLSIGIEAERGENVVIGGEHCGNWAQLLWRNKGAHVHP